MISNFRWMLRAFTFFYGYKNFKEGKPIKDQLINDQINLPKVRLVGETGEQLGIMSSQEANRIADDHNLDLVLMSPNAEPPVCRLMNYGKFKFEQTKKLKEQRKAQKIVELKEIQLSMTIERHDLEVKAKHARRFLENGDKVKVTIRMRGRQQARPEAGIQVMNQFAEGLQDLGSVEKPAEILGRNINMVIAPIKNK